TPSPHPFPNSCSKVRPVKSSQHWLKYVARESAPEIQIIAGTESAMFWNCRSFACGVFARSEGLANGGCCLGCGGNVARFGTPGWLGFGRSEPVPGSWRSWITDSTAANNCRDSSDLAT